MPRPDVALGDRDHQPQVRLDQFAFGELAVALHPSQEVVELLAALRFVGLGDPVSADALDLAELLGLMIADRDDRLDDLAQTLVVDAVVLLGQLAELGGELPGLDPPSQVHLLSGGEERDLPDLLQVHPDRVVRRRLQQVDVDLALRGRVDLVAGDLDDLDPLAAQVLLDLGEEVLDLFGREVLDRDGFEDVFGGHEAPLTSASGDLFLRFFQTQVAGDFRQRLQPLRSDGRTRRVYETRTAADPGDPARHPLGSGAARLARGDAEALRPRR